MPGPENERWRWIALASAAFVPRVTGAIFRQPWHDEYFTAWTARLSLHDLLAALRLDSGPPLPYLLVKLFAGVGVEPIAAARGISVVAGTTAVLLAARAARRAFGARAGWWTGGLLAAHPLAVAWSCEGRAYALVLLAAAWAWDSVESLAKRGRGAVGVALAVSLACWSHGLGLLLAVVLGVVALTLTPPLRLRTLAGVGAGLASHLPWLPIALHQPPAAVAWMTAAWRSMPFADRLIAPVRLLSPAAAFATAVDLPSSPQVVDALAAVALAALVVAGCRSHGWARLALGFVAPVVALGALAFLGVPAFYPGRGEVLAIVPLLVLAGNAAGSRRFGAVGGAALVCAGAVTVARAGLEWARCPARDEQRVANALRRTMPRGGTVVVGGYLRLGLAYHLGERPPFNLLSYPAEAARHPGWYDPATDRRAPSELTGLLTGGARDHSQIAVVAAPWLDTTPDLEALAAELRLRREPGILGARLFVPAPDRPGGGATAP